LVGSAKVTMEKHAQFNLWSVPLLTGRRKVLEAGAKQLLEKALLYGSDLTVLRATLRTGAAGAAPAALIAA